MRCKSTRRTRRARAGSRVVPASLGRGDVQDVVSADECVAVVALELSLHVLLGLLHRHVHVSVQAGQHADVIRAVVEAHDHAFAADPAQEIRRGARSTCLHPRTRSRTRLTNRKGRNEVRKRREKPLDVQARSKRGSANGDAMKPPPSIPFDNLSISFPKIPMKRGQGIDLRGSDRVGPRRGGDERDPLGAVERDPRVDSDRCNPKFVG
eukprot:scaffold584_cov338-Pavlova_lutheri.AAC.39